MPLDILNKRTLFFDGAMGSMLQLRFSRPGVCLEELNLSQSREVLRVHREYVEAGVDVIETNTLGGNRIKLEEHGLGHKVQEINRQAVRIAREAASGGCLVALSVGSTGKFLEPIGGLSFDEARNVFQEQISAAVAEGIDLVVIETISDLKEMRAAVVAAKEVTSLPIMATMTFQEDGRTLLGTGPRAAAVCLEALGVSIIGANCGTGPEAMLPVLRELSRATGARLAIQPNAGMPRLEGGRTVFPADPRQMAELYKSFVKEGAHVVGGCCGTTPQHIRAMIEAVDGLKPEAAGGRDSGGTTLSTRTSVISLGEGFPPVKIGERINPTGRKKLTSELLDGNLDTLIVEAREQVELGADMLDVNVGAPGADEADLMGRAILTIQKHTAAPLVIDSSSPQAIEAGLKAADGKLLINSVNGDGESLEAILPLAVKYGAAVIGLTLDQEGVPEKASERLKIAGRIQSAALRAGLPHQDLVIDCLTLSISTDQELALETLRAIRLIKSELGLAVTLGVSNVSFGLPQRGLINSAFLAMAIVSGLDGAIFNPKDARMMEAFHASSLLAGKDPKALGYIKFCGKSSPRIPATEAAKSPGIRRKLFEAVVDGHKEEITHLVEKALGEGIAPLRISDEVLIPALEKVGERFNSKDFFLPQVMLSAETAKAAFSLINNELKEEEIVSRGKIIMATVRGDIHDIGKNIVTMLLENHGFEVFDLGINVSPEKITEMAEREGVDLIGLSALMTTTMMEMRKSVEFLKDAGLACPVMVGGAAVTGEFATQIGADAYGSDAVEAVKIAKTLIEERK